MPANLLAPDSSAEVLHQFSRLQSMTAWWHWLLFVSICFAVVISIALLYRRDASDLARAKRWLLLGLRIAAFAGILVFFLDLERRSQQEVVETSRALLLVDTSLSMGIQDDLSGEPRRRIDQVVAELAAGDLVDQLREQHDVVVYRFGDTDTPFEAGSIPKFGTAGERQPGGGGTQDRQKQDAITQARLLAGIAAGVLSIAVLALLLHFLWLVLGRSRDGSWALLVGVASLLISAVVFAVANLRHPDVSLAETVGWAGVNRESEGSPASEDSESGSEELEEQFDWARLLAPQGGSTRLGDALRYLVQRERGTSLAGIVVVSDGGNNAGIAPDEAIASARAGQIPIYTIGIGGVDRPRNVRLVDVEAPTRVYPGDSFTLNGYVQSYGFSGQTVRVTLQSVDAATEREQALVEFEADRSLRLGADGEPVQIRFEVTPREQGDRIYELVVAAPEQDTDGSDNQRSAKVQIVARKNKVLILAGGPTREYRFLRDLLYRDRDTELSVLLQTAELGMSQEADHLLSEFPATPAELFEYDCIVAFDPNWLAIEAHAIDLLERWVSEEAGGLIVVAGAVHTGQWANRLRSSPQLSTIRALYPVIFYSRGSVSVGRFSSDTPWQLQFSPDGRDAEFLWLGDDSLESEQAWNSFEGVYGYYAVKDPKSAATVYSRFSDPATAVDGELPIYMAGHFYGAGRVFFQGSGEMWRIRAVNDAHFEQYYTKLIRWASQGRLLRDSSRGVLLVDKSRCLLGDHVSVRAILTDAQHRPLVAEQVTATLVQPDGTRTPLILRRLSDATHGGMFASQFTAVLEGDYRVELQAPHGDEDELLARDVRVRIPARETERPERNDPLLLNLAEQTGGRYYIGFDKAVNPQDAEAAALHSLLQPQDRTSYVAGTPDKEFEQVLMTWLMGIICGALCLEWLIRRLSRLA